MKKNSLIYGASVLTIGAFLSKAIGSVYRLFLTYVIGGEGIGLYQMVFPVYSFLIVLSTGGIPLAISKIIAECNANKNDERKKRTITLSLSILVILSIIFALILTFGAKKIAILQGNVMISDSYLVIAPALVFVSVLSVMRGYFQGECDFVPTAVSQIIEQVIKVLSGMALAMTLVKYSVADAVTGAVLAVTISEFVSAVIICIWYCRRKKYRTATPCDCDPITLRQIIKVALPITLTTMVLPLTFCLDSFLVVNLLKRNFTTAVATSMYGLESGVVMSIVNFPSIISFSLASVLLPNLVKNIKTHNVYDNTEKLNACIKINLIISLPCMIGGVIFGKNLMNLIYGTALLPVDLAGELLSLSSISILYMGFMQIFSMSLQAYDRRYVTLRNVLVAVLVKVVFECIFLSTKTINIYALALANVLCYMVAMLLDMFSLKRCIDFAISIYDSLKILYSTAIAISVMYVMSVLMQGRFDFLVCLAVGGVLYVMALYALGVFDNMYENKVFNQKTIRKR